MSKKAKKHEKTVDIEPQIKVETERNAHKCGTLLEALQDVLEASKDSQFCMSVCRCEEWACHAFDYLNEHLGLTDEQSVLLAIIMEEGMDGSASIRDISVHLGCTRLEVLQHTTDLEALQEKGVVYPYGRNSYRLEEDAFEAFKENKEYVYSINKFETEEELFVELNQLYNMASNREISSKELNRKVKLYLEENRELHMAQTLTSYIQKLDDAEFRFLIAVTVSWLVFDDSLALKDARFIFDGMNTCRLLGSNLLKGTSKLVTLGIIECAFNDGTAIQNEYCLTPKAKKAISPEWAKVKGTLMKRTDLKEANKIVKKELFYNDMESREISDLQSLMLDSNMKNVLRRLKQRKLRGGFTCLFYGAPGTGKTETVYQLARRSGRDIFVVDVSQLRSKWVGESEQNVKGIFDEYRTICETHKKKPILLLNEADAIICKRMEGAERSVDKSENSIQNIILQEMESLDGILIATTNLSKNMNKAFERRFLYKVEFHKPETKVRAKIWHSMLPELSENESILLAESFSEFAGGQIENITRKALVAEALRGTRLSMNDIVDLCQHEMLDNADANRKNIGFRS